LKQYYLNRGAAPKVVLLPFAVEDSDLFAKLMEQHTGKRLRIRVPQRGDNVRLVELAIKNAFEEATRVTSKEEKITGSLNLLGKMLMIEPPVRMESFDISNISGTDIVASMVVFENGRPKKSDYKKYKLEGLTDQDDYESMRQVLQRRFRRYAEQDKGFDIAPNLLLIDGGLNHARIAREVLESFHLEIPVVGMVKDNRHRTRALVTPEGSEIGIDTQQAVFSLIGNIQEETHRFAINYHRQLRSKRLRYSQLDEIPGIGERRKQQLLKNFKSLDGIKAAALSELRRCLPVDAAQNVYKYFHSEVTGD
jgi:excinuclease ABC subunit C